MTEPTQASTATALASLAKSLKRVKIWLLVLTLVVVVGPLLVVGGLAFLFFGIAGNAGAYGPVSGEQIAAAEKDVRSAYGNDLASVTVRSVKVEYEGIPFPFSLASNDESILYVEYRLNGSSVTVAGTGNGMSPGMQAEAALMGLLPTQGPLTHRLTRQQFDALLQEFGRQTKSPLGSVSRYGWQNNAEQFEEDGSGPKEVTIKDRKYPTAELWSALVGRKVTGDSIKETELFGARKALIFHLDPDAQVFTYLATEPVEGYF